MPDFGVVVATNMLAVGAVMATATPVTEHATGAYYVNGILCYGMACYIMLQYCIVVIDYINIVHYK